MPTIVPKTTIPRRSITAASSFGRVNRAGRVPGADPRYAFLRNFANRFEIFSLVFGSSALRSIFFSRSFALGDRANFSACFISFPIDIPSSERGDDLTRTAEPMVNLQASGARRRVDVTPS